MDVFWSDKRRIVFADSSEPKSIEELYRLGYNVKPCVKGKDSINIGIDLLKRFKLCVTTKSTNLNIGVQWLQMARGQERLPTE